MPGWKTIAWLGDSLARLKAAPAEVRSDVGYELQRIQQGQMPSDFKPMADVGPGVVELRIHSANEYRVFYVARFPEAVYVLHCFVKKSRTTAQADMDIGKSRYAALLEARRRQS